MTETSINEKSWRESYPPLYALVLRWVRQFNVSHWQGQEEDVAWDIVQESMRRVYEYSELVAQGEREPIQSLAALLSTVAQNYCRDLRRSEWRLSKEADRVPQGFVDMLNFSEVAIESVYGEHLVSILAHEIAHCPPKQREAILTDLANRMAFGEQLSPLQSAFQAEEICLEEYCKPRPESEPERRRDAALLTHAYKRLKFRERVRDYLE